MDALVALAKEAWRWLGENSAPLQGLGVLVAIGVGIWQLVNGAPLRFLRLFVVALVNVPLLLLRFVFWLGGQLLSLRVVRAETLRDLRSESDRLRQERTDLVEKARRALAAPTLNRPLTLPERVNKAIEFCESELARWDHADPRTRTNAHFRAAARMIGEVVEDMLSAGMSLPYQLDKDMGRFPNPSRAQIEECVELMREIDWNDE